MYKIAMKSRDEKVSQAPHLYDTLLDAKHEASRLINDEGFVFVSVRKLKKDGRMDMRTRDMGFSKGPYHKS